MADERIKILSMGGHTFKMVRFSAMEQFHIARKLAGLFSGVLTGAQGGGEMQLGGFLDRIAAMSEQESSALFCRLLSQTYIEDPNAPGGYGGLVKGGMLMRDDLDLACYVRLAWEAVSFNLGNFTQEITAIASAAPAKK